MRKEYQVSVKDMVFQLEGKKLDAVSSEAGVFHILKNNKAYRAKVIETDFTAKTFVIEVNGHSYSLSIADQFDQLIQQLGLSSVSAQKANDVKAPMPGLVLSIEVAVGQAVKKGEPLLILEAMKMENIIKSIGDGVIKAVRVDKGMPVDKGQLLIEMESA